MSASADIRMLLKASSSESGSKLERGYQAAASGRNFPVAAGAAAQDELQLWLKVRLVYFSKVRCAASQFDLLEGDLRVFVYTALVHQRKVGHLGRYSLDTVLSTLCCRSV